MASSITIPVLLEYAVAQDGDQTAIPVDGTSNTADTTPSQQFGFPELFSEKIEDGGEPILRDQFNGFMNYITNILRYLQAGGQWHYDSTFANYDTVTGYPEDAILFDTTNKIWWRNTVDGNVNGTPSVPEAGLDSSGWIQYAVGDITNAPYGLVVNQSVTSRVAFTIAFSETLTSVSAYYQYRTYSSAVTKFIITFTATIPATSGLGTGSFAINLYAVLNSLGLPLYTNNLPRANGIYPNSGYSFPLFFGFSNSESAGITTATAETPAITDSDTLPLYQLISAERPYLFISISGLPASGYNGTIEFELTNNL